jgi:hypothetical protein
VALEMLEYLGYGKSWAERKGWCVANAKGPSTRVVSHDVGRLSCSLGLQPQQEEEQEAFLPCDS